MDLLQINKIIKTDKQTKPCPSHRQTDFLKIVNHTRKNKINAINKRSLDTVIQLESKNDDLLHFITCDILCICMSIVKPVNIVII